MILVDTSAWIEFDRATDSPVDQRLVELIADDAGVAVTEPVIAEIVASARSDEQQISLRRLLNGFELLPFDGVIDFDGAATVYRQCRRASVTPRGMLDCMIAAVAIRHDVPVLSYDVDFARIADVTALELDRASLRKV